MKWLDVFIKSITFSSPQFWGHLLKSEPMFRSAENSANYISSKLRTSRSPQFWGEYICPKLDKSLFSAKLRSTRFWIISESSSLEIRAQHEANITTKQITMIIDDRKVP